MDLNGISPVQNLILNLLRSTQQEDTPLQVQGDKQPVITKNVQVNVQAASQTPNALSKDSIVHEIAMPERSLPRVLPNFFTDALQGTDVQTLAKMFQRLGMDYEKRLLKALNLNQALQSKWEQLDVEHVKFFRRYHSVFGIG